MTAIALSEFSYKQHVTLGADPEFVLYNTKKGINVAAWDVTKGLKDAPHLLYKSAGRSRQDVDISIHADGAALEITTSVIPLGAFKVAIAGALGFVGTQLGSNFVLRPLPEVTDFSVEILKHPLCATIGCDPDFWAYAEDPEAPRPVPFDPLKTKSRFFGGHIHVGYPTNLIPEWAMARIMDLIVGLATLSEDKQGGRRPIYGIAGLYRPKPYGVEYRTLSSFWTQKTTTMELIDSNIRNFFNTFQEYPEAINTWFNAQKWDQVQKIMASEKGSDAVDYFDKYVVPVFLKYVGHQMYHL